MADEKQSKKLVGKPLDGNQRVSRNTDVMEKRQGQWVEPLTHMTFTTGEVASKNYGKDVSLEELAKDQKEFTGKSQGFFKKFGSTKVS